ncbi:MAG TPA: hypothetical protein DEB74_12485 [Lachnospiraceae bacterium]|nr:hypothetical protein [Lachnospiraceae bacterium]
MPDNSAFVQSMAEAAMQIISETARRMSIACLVVEEEAKGGCPVDMGILRASITSAVEVSGTEITGYIGSNLEYAPYVHNGTGIYAKDGNGRKRPWGYEAKAGKYKGFHWTRGQRPQPFLQKAVFKSKNAVEQILGGGW